MYVPKLRLARKAAREVVLRRGSLRGSIRDRPFGPAHDKRVRRATEKNYETRASVWESLGTRMPVWSGRRICDI